MKASDKNSNQPLLRIVKAFRYSVDGLVASWKDEQAFRQEVVLGILLTPLAVLMPIELSIRLAVILSMFVVLIAELLNSSIEALTDLITKDFHDLAKKAKDCASAAVLISLICSGSMWLLALYTWYSKWNT